jgi:hydroxymethylpyrimidine pyrophosphatase-like HAD family hydrolase
MNRPLETTGAWLVALDIDGTMLHGNGPISDAVIEQVRRVDADGHQVMLATGRSAATTIPVLEQLGIAPRFLICSNGAITLHRDRTAPGGYRREWVECFDPTEALSVIHTQLGNARFAVEDEHGHFRYTEPFPEGELRHRLDALARHRGRRGEQGYGNGTRAGRARHPAEPRDGCGRRPQRRRAA